MATKKKAVKKGVPPSKTRAGAARRVYINIYPDGQHLMHRSLKSAIACCRADGKTYTGLVREVRAPGRK